MKVTTREVMTVLIVILVIIGVVSLIVFGVKNTTVRWDEERIEYQEKRLDPFNEEVYEWQYCNRLYLFDDETQTYSKPYDGSYRTEGIEMFVSYGNEKLILSTGIKFICEVE